MADASPTPASLTANKDAIQALLVPTGAAFYVGRKYLAQADEAYRYVWIWVDATPQESRRTVGGVTSRLTGAVSADVYCWGSDVDQCWRMWQALITASRVALEGMANIQVGKADIYDEDDEYTRDGACFRARLTLFCTLLDVNLTNPITDAVQTTGRALYVALDRSTVTAAGTNPPPITVTGDALSLDGIAPLCQVQILTPGPLGTATFRWSKDNGVTWEESGVTTTASYPLHDTGLTVQFPDGAYASDNFYVFYNRSPVVGDGLLDGGEDSP